MKGSTKLRKRTILVLTGVSITIMSVGAFLLISKTRNSIAENSSIKGAEYNIYSVACSILTKSVAESLIGKKNIKIDTDNSQSSSTDIAVSSCAYSVEFDGGTINLGGIKSVTLLARVALTDVGRRSNQEKFGSYRPANSEEVLNYGDKAYWLPNMGELHILKNDNWYVLTNGISKAADRTLSDTEKFADAIVKAL